MPAAVGLVIGYGLFTTLCFGYWKIANPRHNLLCSTVTFIIVPHNRRSTEITISRNTEYVIGHRDAPRVPKRVPGGILMSSPWPLLSFSLAFAIFRLSQYPLKQRKGTRTALMCVQINGRLTKIPILRNTENTIVAVIAKRNIIKTKSDVTESLKQRIMLLLGSPVAAPVPINRAISANHCRAILSMQLTVLAPVLCTIGFSERRPIVSV